MFSHTPLGPGPEGLLFELRAQCLSVAVLLSAIDPLHRWRLNLNNNTHTPLASHLCEIPLS